MFPSTDSPKNAVDMFPRTDTLKWHSFYPLKPRWSPNPIGTRFAQRIEVAIEGGQQTFVPNQRFGQMVASDLHWFDFAHHVRSWSCQESPRKATNKGASNGMIRRLRL